MADIAVALGDARREGRILGAVLRASAIKNYAL
jgi:hypothetical protein